MSNTSELNFGPLISSMNSYYTLVAIPIGFLTNILSIIVFMRPTLLKTSMGYFNLLISISNLLSLLFFFFVQQSSIVLNIDLSTQTDVGCRLFMFTRRVMREVSPLIETIMTFERFLTIYYPKKFTFFQNKIFILKLTCAFIFIFALISFENLFHELQITEKSSYQVVNGTTVWKNTTSKSCTGTLLVTVSSDLISATLRTLIPFSLMLVLNVLIAIKVTTKKSVMKNKQSANKSRKERQFTRIVLSLNMVFLILNFPQAIGYGLRNGLLVFNKPSYLTLQIVNLYWAIAYIISTSHYIVTIVTNLVFNRIFRVEICKLFGLCEIFGIQSSSDAQYTVQNTQSVNHFKYIFLIKIDKKLFKVFNQCLLYI